MSGYVMKGLVKNCSCIIACKVALRCRDIQHNGIQHNGVENSDIQHNDTQHNSTKKEQHMVLMLAVFHADCCNGFFISHLLQRALLKRYINVIHKCHNIKRGKLL
jgi:hypothetical protein